MSSETTHDGHVMTGMLDNVYGCLRASQVALVVKDSPASVGDVRDTGFIPGSGRSPGGRHGNPLQYSCLENPVDRGAWRAMLSIELHRVRHN